MYFAGWPDRIIPPRKIGRWWAWIGPYIVGWEPELELEPINKTWCDICCDQCTWNDRGSLIDVVDSLVAELESGVPERTICEPGS